MSISFPRVLRIVVSLCVLVGGGLIQVTGQEARPRTSAAPAPPPVERPTRLVKPVIFTPAPRPAERAVEEKPAPNVKPDVRSRTAAPEPEASIITADRNDLSPALRSYVGAAAAESGATRPRGAAAENSAVTARAANTRGAANSAVALRQLLQRRMLTAIGARLGARYVFGSSGPRTFDCSGFVWSVFREAGYTFERASARSYWSNFAPVSGDARYEFGTLVLLNGLGHIGIVADENGFYHASTSKGVMYSRFDEYWTKRIVGFRRVPLSLLSEEVLEQFDADALIR